MIVGIILDSGSSFSCYLLLEIYNNINNNKLFIFLTIPLDYRCMLTSGLSARCKCRQRNIRTGRNMDWKVLSKREKRILLKDRWNRSLEIHVYFCSMITLLKFLGNSMKSLVAQSHWKIHSIMCNRVEVNAQAGHCLAVVEIHQRTKFRSFTLHKIIGHIHIIYSEVF